MLRQTKYIPLFITLYFNFGYLILGLKIHFYQNHSLLLFQSTVCHDLKAIRWKHIACARGIFCSQTSSRVRDMAKHLWIHEKAPCTEVRNWLRVIMHKHLMPWHFLSIPNNHLPLLCLFAINDWVLTPSHPQKKSHFSSVCVTLTHTAATSTHSGMHSKAYLQPLDLGPMETVLIISLLLQSTAVCFGIRGFLWWLHMHSDWLQAKEKEFFCSINPRHHHPSPSTVLSTQPTNPASLLPSPCLTH